MNNGNAIYIGEIVSERMLALGMDFNYILENSFIGEDVLRKILNNEIYLREIDNIDLDFLASTLYCTTEYFTDTKNRERNRLKLDDINTVKSNIVKAKIQCLMDDLVFLQGIYDKTIER